LRPWFAPAGSGQRCDGCGFTISRYQLMTVRIDAHDWREMRFHQECFEIWDDERMKAQRSV
jgi:hypothetical protein